MTVTARGTAALAAVGVMAFATAAGADAPRAPECFGGTATAVASGQQSPGQVFMSGDSLYFLADGGVRRMVLATKAVSTLAAVPWGEVKTLDARLAVGSNNINQLFGVDLTTGKERILVDGQPFMDEALLFSSLALDASYLYFGRDDDPYPFQRRPGTGFYRMRRDGKGAAEKLAEDPDGATEFIIADGFVYWRRKRPDVQLVRRRLQKGAPIEVIAPAQHAGRGPLAVHGGRVYWLDAGGIFSAPAAGGAPIRQVALGPTPVMDILADGVCVYWRTKGGAIMRARGQDGVAERIASVPAVQDSSPDESVRVLATDGNFLYWADPATGSIMRAARSADAGGPIRTVAAKSTSGQPPREMGAGTLLVGSGWGCVRRVRQGASQLQCWRAADVNARDATIRARPVPWLNVDEYAAGPDRLCALVGQEARCWPSAALFGPAPPDAPPATGTGRTIWDPELAAGTAFTCTAKSKVWSCVGDDSYGQLGRGTAAAPGDRLSGTWAALGAAHGCVADSTSVRCWGRNDAMQLGFASAETCRVGQKDLPCSRAAKPPSFPLPRGSGLTATDTYTCAQRGEHHCWGASRDGIFGTAAACPPGLREAFPTRSGPVVAPNATCSATPAELPAFKSEPGGRAQTYRLAIGPRGACGVVGMDVFCAGAIPTPPKMSVDGLARASVAVSAGDDPSACAVERAGVSCWGAGYSPAASPNRLARVIFADLPGGGAAVDAPPPPAGWPKYCAIENGCDQRALPACAAAANAVPWPTMVSGGGAHDGATVTVSGALVVEADAGPDEPAKERCHPVEPLSIVVGDSKSPLILDGLTCGGDQSRRCCAAPALGQKVVAKGRLAAMGTRWVLRNPELCAAR